MNRDIEVLLDDKNKLLQNTIQRLLGKKSEFEAAKRRWDSERQRFESEAARWLREIHKTDSEGRSYTDINAERNYQKALRNAQNATDNQVKCIRLSSDVGRHITVLETLLKASVLKDFKSQCGRAMSHVTQLIQNFNGYESKLGTLPDLSRMTSGLADSTTLDESNTPHSSGERESSLENSFESSGYEKMRSV